MQYAYTLQWMRFEWDEAKNTANFRKHGVYFEAAEEVFAGQVLTIADTRRDYGEPRYITWGSLRGRVVVIVHTPRGSSTRIVSMRKANERERASYQKFLEAARHAKG